MIRDCPLEPSSEEKAYRKERLQKQREARFQQEPDDDEADDAEGDDTESTHGGDGGLSQGACVQICGASPELQEPRT